MLTTWIDDLSQKVPLSRQPQDLQAYGRDWTRVYVPRPSAVVFPRHPEEVCEVLRFCSERGIAVVPSGGRTGLSAGAVAAEGELVLSLERLRHLGEVDPLGLTLTVGAGITNQEVHQHSEKIGLTWPIDLASKGSCQVGGNLATNAGGIRVIRYGHARQWVTGLQVALIDGTLLKLGTAVQKDNVGPDLRQLMIGSEGILGVITQATLRLTIMPRECQVMFLAVDNIDRGLELLSHARLQGRLQLQAFEFVAQNCLEAVMKVQDRACPFAQIPPAAVLIEVEGRLDNELEQWMEQVMSQGLVRDGVLARSSTERASLWAYRDNITESLGSLGLMHKNDIAVEVGRLGEFVHTLLSEVAPHYPGQMYLFGHLGDGNLHINVMKPSAMDPETFWEGCQRADQLLYELLRNLNGSVSAEHGIGLLKKAALSFSRGPHEVDTVRRVKKALDPQGLLNPGKVFDL
ncbi:FAD-binding oxidoreductase [bacterium]|nr:FAD-binding oxidoreductase [bacterium]